MKNKWLRGANSINIQDIIMVLVHCPPSSCHLSPKQVSFQSLWYFGKIWSGQASIIKKIVMGR